MKICFIGDSRSVHIIDWVEYFAKKSKDVYLISDLENQIESVKVINIGECIPKIYIPGVTATFQILIKAKKIKQVIKEISPDLVHAHYATNYGFLTALSGFHPFILTCHGSDILVDMDKSFISRYFVNKAIQEADYITLPSKQMKERLLDVGIPESKIHQVQYGVDLEKFPFFQKSYERIQIISTRALFEKYRIDILLYSIPEVVKHLNNVEFQVLGDGDQKETLINLCKQLGIENYVKFFGFIPHQEIPKYLESPQIYVTTSPSDGLSISLLEALACGCYPIVPDNPSNRQLKESGFYITLFKVNNSSSLSAAIIEVINTISLLPQKIKENRKLVESLFSREKSMELVSRIYEELAK